MTQHPIVLSVRDLTKKYDRNTVLDQVNIDFYTGEVHALCGQNGAGKSTLIKMLGGAVPKTSGSFVIEGVEADINSPKSAKEFGISVIYQEFSLANNLSIYENIYLGSELKKRGVILDKSSMIANTATLLQDLGIALNPKTIVENLRTGEQQLVEIAKSIRLKAKILIMDEPTSALTQQEKNILFELIGKLKKTGMGIIYISHFLDEVVSVSDRISVLRDGRLSHTMSVGQTDANQIMELMLGKKIAEEQYGRKEDVGEELLRVKGLGSPGKYRDINFVIRKGEVLGLIGLIGSGRTEIARSVFGADPIDEGEIWMQSRQVKIRNPAQAINNGIALIPEDRKLQGLVLGMSILRNSSLVSLRERFQSRWLLKKKKEKQEVVRINQSLNTKLGSVYDDIATLSGGNQQKVVLAKWLLSSKARLFILDEPTRGVDVGAKKEILKIVKQLCEEEKGVLLISSEIDEIVEMSDRVLILRRGEIIRELTGPELNKENVTNWLLNPRTEARYAPNPSV